MDASRLERAVWRVLERLTLASETLLSSEPDMPSHANTELEHEAATDEARALLDSRTAPEPAQAGEAVAWCIRDRHGQRGNVHIEEARARAECDYLNRDPSTPYYIGQGPYEVVTLYAAPSRPSGAPGPASAEAVAREAADLLAEMDAAWPPSQPPPHPKSFQGRFQARVRAVANALRACKAGAA